MSGPKTAIRTRTRPQKTRVNDGPASSDGACCEKIRERAYYKWETAGCPCDDGVGFWLQAEAELDNEMRSLAKSSES